MKPIRLTISAWGPYPKEETIDFTKIQSGEMFLITGPTGSGKTTIFDALTYAIYGMVSGKTRDKNSVRSDFAKEETDTYVELSFFHKGKTYLVKRSPKYNRRKKRGDGFVISSETAELYEEEKPPCTAVKDVNIKLKEIMGFSYEQYKQIAMIAQGEFMELLLASSKERVEIFRNLFKTECYERIQKELSEKAKCLFVEIQEIKHRMEEAISMIDAGEEEEFCALLENEYKNYEKIIINLQKITDRDNNKIKDLEKKVEEDHQKIQTLMTKREVSLSLKKRTETLLSERKEWEEKQKKAEENLLYTLKEREKQKKKWEEEDLFFEEQKKDKAVKEEELEAELQSYETLDKEEGELVLCMEKVKNEKEGLLGIQKKQKALLQEEIVLEKAQKAYEEEARTTREIKNTYEKKEAAYKAAAIGLVARFVEEGKPCPVCGAMEHPKIAFLSEEVPKEQEVKRWKEKWEKEEERLEQIYKKATQEKGILLGMEQELVSSYQALFVTEQTFQKRLLKNQEKENCLSIKLKKLEEKKETKKNLREKQKKLEIEMELEGEKIQRIIAIRKKENEKSMEEESRYGLEAEKGKVIIREKETELNKIKIENEKLGNKKEMESLQEELKEREERKKELQKQKESILAKQKGNQNAENSLKDKWKILKKKEEVYGIYRDLDNIARGNNKDRVVFEQYVLAAYFEDILAAANVRLTHMTTGRYELKKVDKVADGRTTDSLDMEVLDNYTGKCRSVKTLSGGESFKAALSMALGLSDLVQRTKGGIWVDTLFIDEGFGSLDEESLNQALSSLMRLTGKNQMIGIISHVSELKERIEQQITIQRGTEGSTILST
ncbi:MAG: SMC family ATPase [Acetivibrio sp.]